MEVKVAVEQPAPSDDGPTIDLGDKPTPDGGGDDQGESGGSGTIGEDLFGGDSGGDALGGDLGGGGGGLGGGLSEDGSMGGSETSTKTPDVDQQLSPEEQFVETNAATYKQLIDDINKIITEYKPSGKDGKITKKDSREIIEKLRDFQWSNNTLLELSSLGTNQKDDNLSNLDSLIQGIIDDKTKNLSSKKPELDTLLKARGGNYHMPKVKFSFSPDGGVTKTVAAEESKQATSNSEKFLSAKEALKHTIVKARKSIKALNAKATTARGLLYKKLKLSEMDAAPDMEAPAEEVKELDSDIASETGQIGGVAQELQDTLSELTDSINKLTNAVDGLEAGEVPKEEYDGGMELIEEGKEVAEEGDEHLDDVEDLEEEIKAAFTKKPKVKSAESSMKKDDEKKEEKKEDEAKKEASTVSSEKKAGIIATIKTAEELIPAIENGTIESAQDLALIPDAVVASWKNMPEVVNSLRKAGKTQVIEALIERTIDAHLAGKNETVKQAKYTENMIKDIGETSKVMNTREYDKWFEQGSGELDKGFRANESKFNTDTNDYQGNFSTEFSGKAAAPLGSEHEKGKKASISLSTEAALKVRKAFEVAGEEQFKSIIANPLAARMITAFQAAGMTEDEAVETSFEVLADSYEEAVKGLIQRGLTYANASETELLRRAKDVSTYKVSLFGDEEVRTAAKEEGQGQVRTASAQKPALRSGSTSAQEVESNPFDKLRV